MCSCACFSLTLMTCHPPDSSGKGRAVRELQPVGGSLGRRSTGPANTLRGSGPASPQLWGPSAAPAARRQQGGRPGGTRLATSRHSRFPPPGFFAPRGAKNIRGAAPSPWPGPALDPPLPSVASAPGARERKAGAFHPLSFFHFPLKRNHGALKTPRDRAEAAAPPPPPLQQGSRRGKAPEGGRLRPGPNSRARSQEVSGAQLARPRGGENLRCASAPPTLG